MQLEIYHTTSLKDIQGAFNELYPSLWIDFYSRPTISNGKNRAVKIQPETTLSKLGFLHGTWVIDICAQRLVEELEFDFRTCLGLNISILRKSGNVWVGTTLTGAWSLADQNVKGDQVYND